MADPASADLLHTPLDAEHVALGARMVPFAGYAMPVQYPTGILTEHLWTRERAGLFDVSHMGQAALVGPDHATTARAIEALVPADILNLAPGRQRYTQLLNEEGGILDDLMVARPANPLQDGELLLVVNASTKEADYAHMQARLPSGVELRRFDDRALLALQGPAAEAALAALAPEVATMGFMAVTQTMLAGIPAHVSRSGYTGEDGYEISVAADDAVPLAQALLVRDEVRPAGLGARDSLRLEAGLPLYGHEIDSSTSPIEAGLAWSIGKRRREQGGFPGAAVLLRQLAEGTARRLVGLRPDGKAPARDGTEIRGRDGAGLGQVTSGGFGPTVGAPVALGYVATAAATSGTELDLLVRGRALPARVTALPFVPHRYHR
jgi:aminomethyltransferase